MKNKEYNIKEKISLLNYFKLRKKYNTIKLKYDSLKETVKNDLYKAFMDKLNEPTDYGKLKEENKKLRKKIKELKSIIREEVPKDIKLPKGGEEK